MVRKFMKQSLFISDRNPVFECSKQITFFNNFLLPQVSSNWVQVFQNLILTIFNQNPDPFLHNLIHNNFRAIYFLRCILQSLIKIIRTNIPHHKWLIILKNTNLFKLLFQLFWSFYIKTNYAYTNVCWECVWR